MFPRVTGVFRLGKDAEVKALPNSQSGQVLVNIFGFANEFVKGETKSGAWNITWFVSGSSKKIQKLLKGTQIQLSGKWDRTETTDSAGNKREFNTIIVFGYENLDIIYENKSSDTSIQDYTPVTANTQTVQQPNNPPSWSNQSTSQPQPQYQPQPQSQPQPQNQSQDVPPPPPHAIGGYPPPGF